MKNYVAILFLFSVVSLNAQSVKGREVDSIVKIDSLFFYDYGFPFEYQWIKRDKNNLIFEHRVSVYDSTRQVQNRFKEVVDTISLDCLSDSTHLTRLLDKYHLNSRDAFRSFKHLASLIHANSITAIEPAGPGDCEWCSRYIFINNRTAFLILDNNGHCYPEDCYWRSRVARQRRIRKDMYLIRNIRKYH